MNLEAEKLALIKQIIQVEDEEAFAHLREAVEALLQQPVMLPPAISDEELGRHLREARQQAASGDVVSVEELTALVQQWRSK